MVLAETKQRLNVQYASMIHASYPGPAAMAARAEAAAGKRFLLSVVILVGLALCLLYTYQVSRFIALGAQAEKVRSSIADLQTENRRMELEAAKLQAPDRVEQVAVNKLGMTEPADFLVAASTSGQTTGQPQQEAQTSSPSPGSTWSSRLLALLPRLTGQAEASTR